MNLLSLFTGGWKKNGTAAQASAVSVRTAVPVIPHHTPTSLEERQRLLAHHVRLSQEAWRTDFASTALAVDWGRRRSFWRR